MVFTHLLKIQAQLQGYIAENFIGLGKACIEMKGLNDAKDLSTGCMMQVKWQIEKECTINVFEICRAGSYDLPCSSLACRYWEEYCATRYYISIAYFGKKLCQGLLDGCEWIILGQQSRTRRVEEHCE